MGLNPLLTSQKYKLGTLTCVGILVAEKQNKCIDTNIYTCILIVNQWIV